MVCYLGSLIGVDLKHLEASMGLDPLGVLVGLLALGVPVGVEIRDVERRPRFLQVAVELLQVRELL